MNIEFLETIGYQRGIERNAYLINMNHGLDDAVAKGKRIFLLGVSENCYIAERLLEDRNIKVCGYADNSLKKQRRNLRRGTIQDVRELLKNKDVYFIITTTEYSIFQVRLQMLVANIKEYSIFSIIDGNCFKYENDGLHKAYMEGVNCICFEDEKPEVALPQCPYASSLEGKALLPLINVMRVTEWSHYAYIWADDFLSRFDSADMLEIGPGDGLFSYIMLSRHSNIKVTWMIFGDKKKSKEEGFENHLSKVKKCFASRINSIYGMLEVDDDLLKQKYKLIVLTEVFEHFVLNPLNTIEKLSNALEEDGRIVLTTPAWGHQGPYDSWKDIPDYINISGIDRYYELMKLGQVYQYDKNELDDIFEKAGLCVEKYRVSDRNNHNYMLKKK